MTQPLSDSEKRDVARAVGALLPDNAGPSDLDRTMLRRETARALAARGVVLAPQAWARLVREIVEDVEVPFIQGWLFRRMVDSPRMFEGVLEVVNEAAHEWEVRNGS